MHIYYDFTIEMIGFYSEWFKGKKIITFIKRLIKVGQKLKVL